MHTERRLGHPAHPAQTRTPTPPEKNRVVWDGGGIPEADYIIIIAIVNY